ncbi:HK97 family phage prohead protease [Mesorhizobium sp. M0139]|uniref:HK97 family phage prohead protease n=1 Tax=Mesorhizobium sp. M0139 TaxID=2956892 RepID=UPI00333976D1
MIIPALPPEPARLIAGWAVRWHSPAEITCPTRGKFIETIEPQCFSAAVASGVVDLIFSHDRRRGVIATQRNGSLKLSQDSAGLWFEAEVGDSAIGDEALEVVRGAGYRAASVGMTEALSRWSYDRDGRHHRAIMSAGLREISICSRGAHPSARIAAGRLPIERLKAEGRLDRLARAEAEVASQRAWGSADIRGLPDPYRCERPAL